MAWLGMGLAPSRSPASNEPVPWFPAALVGSGIVPDSIDVAACDTSRIPAGHADDNTPPGCRTAPRSATNPRSRPRGPRNLCFGLFWSISRRSIESERGSEADVRARCASGLSIGGEPWQGTRGALVGGAISSASSSEALSQRKAALLAGTRQRAGEQGCSAVGSRKATSLDP